MSSLEALIRKTRDDAFKGNLRAAFNLMHKYEDAIPDEPVRVNAIGPAAVDLDDSDQAVLAALTGLLLEERENRQ